MCETAFDTAMMGGLDDVIRKRDITDARKRCTDQAGNTEKACILANELTSSVNKYCSDNKNNGEVKQGIHWMAKMVGKRCEGRSSASTLIMTATTAIIASALF